MFFGQYINTSSLLYIVYLNYGYDPKASSDPNSLFGGPYLDVNNDWYLVPGSVIIIVVAQMMFMPQIFILINSIFISSIRFLDTGCTCNRKNTKKVSQKDYEDLYTGPEFPLHIRFAQLMVIIFLVLSYGSSMPILYLFAFVYCLITFWTDKIFVLRFYKK